MPLAIFKSLHWTKKYGFNDYSPPVMATTGIILSGVLNDLQGGSFYAKMALAGLKKRNCRLTEARTFFCAYLVLIWTTPAKDTLKPLLKGYQIGLQTGDTESAMWAICNYTLHRYQAGTALQSLEADYRVYTKQMQDLGRLKTFHLAILARQMYLNLMFPVGHESKESSPTHLDLDGSSFPKERYEKVLKEDEFVRAHYDYFQILLYTMFGEYEKAAMLAVRVGGDAYQEAAPGSPNLMTDIFAKGVSCFAASRIKRNRKFEALGRQMLKKVKMWIESGNPNVHHYEALLDAELAALKGRYFEAIKCYRIAVIMSARNGYIQDAALSHERFADFHLNIMSDKEEGIYHLKEAIKYYTEWNALAKVQVLEEKYADLLPQKPQIISIAR